MPTVSLPQLKDIRIASPCPARWEDMQGEDVHRFCAQCQLRVSNLSAMTEAEAYAFLENAALRQEGREGGRVCVRLYRRADGTVLTRDCPVGVSRARAALRQAGARVAALLGLSVVAAHAAGLASRREHFSLRALPPVQWLQAKFFPAESVPFQGAMVMGEFVMPTTPTPPTTARGAGDQP